MMRKKGISCVYFIASCEQGLTKHKVKRKSVNVKQCSISTYIVRILIYTKLFTL
jgi:hypothetical protein